jgi:hypothetical protein
VPVVSEDPRPDYPSTGYSSAEESWSTPPAFPPYKEANIKLCHATSAEGVYKENRTGERFRFSYIPGVVEPLRVYLPGRNSCFFWGNPNYQGGHRLLTEAEQQLYQEECPRVVQKYTKNNNLLFPPLPNPPGARLISDIRCAEYDRYLCVNFDDNRPWPFVTKLSDNKLVVSSYLPLPSICRYIKHRFLEWAAAEGHLSGQRFFVDLWSPEAIAVICDPTKDNHPRAKLIRDWERKRAEEAANPTPKRKRKRVRHT